MTCEPCEEKNAGRLSFVQQDAQRLHQTAAIGPPVDRAGDLGPAGREAKASCMADGWNLAPFSR